MTVTTFLIILAICATATALITEGIKKMLTDKKYSANVLALIVSIIVGAAATIIYYIFNNLEWNVVNIICIFLMIIANWLSAMLGYDKIKQAILQIAQKE